MVRLEVVSRLDRLRGFFAGFPFVEWGLALAIGAIGVVFIHSATLDDENFAGQAPRHAAALVALALLMAPVAYLPRARLLRAAWLVYCGAVVMLALVPVFGVTINGAKRWFRVAGTSIQPTELLKPALILVLARWLRFRSKAGFVESVGVPLALTVVPFLLMVRQPDLGSALSLLPVLLAMCWVSGARARTLIAIAVLGVLCLVAVFPALHGYQKERILVWLAQSEMSQVQRSGAGYHLWQSLVAVGSGGLTGSGLFEGLQNRFDFLQYRSTDFLFAVVAEETGLVGGLTMIAVYLGFCILMLRRAARIRDRFGRLLAAGVAAYFATHLFIHVGVCTGLLAPTGLPLPLLSYGRSSLIGAWAALALFAHASLQRERNLSGDMFL